MRRTSKKRKEETSHSRRMRRDNITVVALYDRLLKRVTGKYAERISVRRGAKSSEVVNKILKSYPQIGKEFAPTELSLRKNSHVPNAFEAAVDGDRYHFAIDVNESAVDESDFEMLVLETLSEHAPNTLSKPVLHHMVLEKIEKKRESERLESNAKQESQDERFETPIRSVEGEFLDTFHFTALDYQDILNSAPDAETLKDALRDIIDCDKYYFDPYLDLSAILNREGKHRTADRLIKRAYDMAIYRITDREGISPSLMLWACEENRHIMRAIERYAYLMWEKGNRSKALKSFKLLISMNPDDEQGIRYAMLALLMGLASDWNKAFVSDFSPYDERMPVPVMDGAKLEEWFSKNAKHFRKHFSQHIVT